MNHDGIGTNAIGDNDAGEHRPAAALHLSDITVLQAQFLCSIGMHPHRLTIFNIGTE